jgi:uncharacterized protein
VTVVGRESTREAALINLRIELAGPLAAVLPGRMPAFPVTRERRLPAPTSIKDSLEALGLPHVEVGRVTVDGRPATLDDVVADDAVIAAWPVEPAALAEARFLCDVHLGKLARLLRIMGFDTVAAASPLATAVARQAIREDRVLLSRGRAVLERREVRHGMLILPDRVDDQAVAVLRRFVLAGRIAPFSRCARCNGRLTPVVKSVVAARIPPLTAAWLDTYHQCTSCAQLYWAGTHVERLRERLAQIASRAS